MTVEQITNKMIKENKITTHSSNSTFIGFLDDEPKIYTKNISDKAYGLNIQYIAGSEQVGQAKWGLSWCLPKAFVRKSKNTGKWYISVPNDFTFKVTSYNYDARQSSELTYTAYEFKELITNIRKKK